MHKILTYIMKNPLFIKIYEISVIVMNFIKPQKWYIVEGNIGSGKSTFLYQYEKNKNVELIYEPVKKWLSIKDSDGKNLLQYFYEDMNRYSFMFQSMVFKTRLEAINPPQQKPLRISERSIWTDKYIFGKMCTDTNKMNSIESECYKYSYNWLEKKFNKKPTGIIYIKCSPNKCLERINSRGRPEENNISLDYLTQLHNYHEDWLNKSTDIPVIIVDNENDNDWESLLNNVNNIIKCQ